MTSEPLTGTAAPDAMVRRLAGAEGLVCLWGAWAGGGTIVTSDPVVVLDPDDDHHAALGMLPIVDGIDPDVVGGGWFGWLGYDADSRRLAFHDHVLRLRDGRWFFETLWCAERAEALAAARARAAELTASGSVTPTRAGPAMTFDGPRRDEHLAAVEEAIGLIRAGELYQVNVCTRLRAPWSGSAAALFADAAAALRPSFGALVTGAQQAVVSMSPELFLRRRGRAVTTSPIKGTLPRSADAQTLRRSAKDAAENVMIVDLMRNDLGRVCETGSVRVAELLSVQPHPGVWHLVSTITGRLRPDVDDAALLRATFPPGSVTGAPKLRAVEAIAELEHDPRGAYTGVIGFASPCWGLELNVAIRSFALDGRTLELGVGGGVTVDSVPVLEWQECRHKAAPLLASLGAALPTDVEPAVPTGAQLAGGLLETILAIDGRPLRLADHLARLDRSCRELYGTGLPADLAMRVLERATGEGRIAVRIVARAAADGLAITVTAAPAQARPGPQPTRTVGRTDGSWRHKWADRSAHAALESAVPGAALILDGDGNVLETTRGNVFGLQEDGTLITPPLGEGLLPGVTRRAVLDLARDQGRPAQLRSFGVEQLDAAFWTSSLSGPVPITEVDGRPLARRDEVVFEFARLLGFTPSGTERGGMPRES